jgi:hypothetical protein
MNHHSAPHSRLLKTALAITLAGAAHHSASAAWLTGDISFQGTAILNAPIATATSVDAYVYPIVGLGTQSGAYSGTDGDVVNFAPFTFSPIVNGSLPVTLWAFFDLPSHRTFTFQALGLTAVSRKEVNGITVLNIEGVGLAGATGYSDTPGKFTFTFSSTKATGTFQSYTVVPEPATSALVAGLGLVGFGLWRRRA